MMTTSGKPSLLIVAVVLLCSGSVAGQARDSDLEIRQFDRIVDKNGKVWEGEIIEERPDGYRIQLGGRGTVTTILKEDVAEVFRKNPPEAVYEVRLRRLDDESFAAQKQLGRWCMTPGVDLPGFAIRHLETANRLDPEDREVYEWLLDLYSRSPDEQKSIAERDGEMGVYLRALEAGLEIPLVPYRAARLLRLLDDPDGAIVMLEILRSMPDTSSVDMEAAEEMLVTLLDESGRRDEAVLLVDEILSETEGEKPAALLLLRGRWLLEELSLDPETHGPQLEELVSEILSGGENGAARYLRGCARQMAGRLEEARRDFAAARAAGVVGGGPSSTYALQFAREGRYSAAHAALRQVRNTQDPAVALTSSLVRAYLLENEGESDEALAVLTESVGSERATWQTWILYLHTLLRLKPDLPLQDAVEEVLRRFGENPIAFAECSLILGDAALREADGADARRWLDYARMVFPDDPEVLIRLGQAHLMPDGDLGRARFYLEAAFQRRPEDRGLRNALGCLEYREGNYSLAQRWFEGVRAEYGEKELESVEPPAALAYALRGLRQVNTLRGEEVWTDDFVREERSAAKVLNNWIFEEETFGIEISHENGSVVFAGEQKFVDQGLTKLMRAENSGERLRGIRAWLRIAEGADRVRVGLRLEDSEGRQGLVFYRDLDGVLAFALIQRDEIIEIRPGGEDDESQSRGEEYRLRELRWEDDGRFHLLEIRVDPDGGGKAALYFDGERVAAEIALRLGRRQGDARVGLSGQAALGERYRFEVQDFTIYRALLEGRVRQRR